MNELNLLLARNKDFKFIGVKFTTFYDDCTKPLNNGKTYYYKTTEAFELNDNAVVDIHGQLKIVKIVELDCILTASDYKWIVCRVNKDHYRHCQEVEKELQLQLNTFRLAKLRKELTIELTEELGAAAVKKLVKL